MMHAQPTPLRDDGRTPVRGWLVEAATWIGAGVGAFLALVLCSELALAGAGSQASVDTRSRNHADYSPWPNSVIHRVQAQIVEAFVRDSMASPENLGNPPSVALVPGDFWSTQVGPHDSAQTPTPTPLPVSEGLESPTPPVLSPVTATNTAAFASRTSTPAWTYTPSPTFIPSASGTPTVSPTPSPSRTNTPRPTVAPSATSNPTAPPTPAPSRTYTPSPTVVPPATSTPAMSPTPYASPTATSFQVGGTYWLQNDTNPLAYMMRQTAPTGSEQSVSGMVISRFHSPAFQSGASLPAGTTTLSIYVTNASPMNTMIGMVLYAGEGSYTLLGSKTSSIPGGLTTPSLQTFSFNTDSYSFAEGQRLKLEIHGNFGLTIYWDGQYADSKVVLP